jgi:flagellar basal body rod protein FlgG
MTNLISGLAEVMSAEIKNLDTIANNTANLNTPGFRAEYASLKSVNFLSKIQPASTEYASKSLAANQMNHSAVMQRTVQQNDGGIKTSGINSHMALRGEAWFVVEKNNQLYLTRNGMFKVDADGNLKTGNGASVIGESGPIGGLSGDFTVGNDGKIIQNDKQLGQLMIVATTPEATFIHKGDSLYETSSFLEKAAPGSYSILTGVYEGSNTDTAADMIRLMQTTRHIETIQRSIAAYDQLLNVGINQLGK